MSLSTLRVVVVAVGMLISYPTCLAFQPAFPKLEEVDDPAPFYEAFKSSDLWGCVSAYEDIEIGVPRAWEEAPEKVQLRCEFKTNPSKSKFGVRYGCILWVKLLDSALVAPDSSLAVWSRLPEMIEQFESNPGIALFLTEAQVTEYVFNGNEFYAPSRMPDCVNYLVEERKIPYFYLIDETLLDSLHLYLPGNDSLLSIITDFRRFVGMKQAWLERSRLWISGRSFPRHGHPELTYNLASGSIMELTLPCDSAWTSLEVLVMARQMALSALADSGYEGCTPGRGRGRPYLSLSTIPGYWDNRLKVSMYVMCPRYQRPIDVEFWLFPDSSIERFRVTVRD